MRNPSCIVISGMDGSGKTTLANWLVDYLTSKGYKTKYVWIRAQHTIAYVISRVLTTLGWYRTFKNPNGVVVIRMKVHESTFAKKVWSTIEFVSVLPLILFKVRLPLLLGYKLVFDRYIIDTIISISMITQNTNFADSFLGRLLLSMMPKEYVLIILDVDLPTVLKRRPDVEYSLDEIKNSINLYRKLARKMKALTLNTAINKVEQTRNVILSLLFPTELIPKFPIDSNMPLDFSIVIPTYNRVTRLKTLWMSILDQEVLPKEVIVVDQSDNLLTLKAANEMKKRFLDKKIRLKYFHFNPKSGSKARNLGIDHSTGNIVFFIDDDVVLCRNYTKDVLNIYGTHPYAVGVQGLIMNPITPVEVRSLGGRLENQLRKMFFLSYYEKNTWKILPSVNDVFPFPLTKVISTQRMQGCCSYRQEILNVFRYDEKLEGWSFLEDFDVSYRIFKSTSGLLYLNPKAKLIHREHIHMSSSLKAEGYKKIVNRTYMFFKLIKQSPYNYLIFVWGIFGLLLTTILGAMSGKRKERSTWLPIYLIEATFYTLKHLKEIKQLNLQTLENL